MQEDGWARCLSDPFWWCQRENDDFRVQIASICLSRRWWCGDDRDGLIGGIFGGVILTKRGADWPQSAWWGILLLGCYISISLDFVPALGLTMHDCGWITVLALALLLQYKRLPLNVVKQGKGQEVTKGEPRKEEGRKVNQYGTGCLCWACDEGLQRWFRFWLHVMRHIRKLWLQHISKKD